MTFPKTIEHHDFQGKPRRFIEQEDGTYSDGIWKDFIEAEVEAGRATIIPPAQLKREAKERLEKQIAALEDI